MLDETSGAPSPSGAGPEDSVPYPDEVLFAPPQGEVVPRPVYRHKRIKSLYTKGIGLTRLWSVERIIVCLLCISAFGLIGVGVADAFFCPEGTSARFWEGCLYETIGFGAGGALLGFAVSILALQVFGHGPSSKPDSATSE